MAKPPRKLHRVTGLLAAAPIILLVITGIPLQFTDGLDLGTKPVNWTWVLDRYHIQAPDTALQSGDARQLGQSLWVANRQITSPTRLVGAVQHNGFVVVALSDRILLVPNDINVPFESAPTPTAITRFGETRDGNLLAQTASGLLLSHNLGASWVASDQPDGEPRWAVLDCTAATTAWQHEYRASKLSWERWLQDLHSGRFFGAVGEWVMNLASLALLLLAVTGLIVWMRLRK